MLVFMLKRNSFCLRDILKMHHWSFFIKTTQRRSRNLFHITRPDLSSLAPISGRQIFFIKNLVLPVTRYHDQLSWCTKSEKTNDPILGKLSKGRADGPTDVQTDESNFIGRCPTIVERRIAMVKVLLVFSKGMN